MGSSARRELTRDPAKGEAAPPPEPGDFLGLAVIFGLADAVFDFMRWIDIKGGTVAQVDDGIAFLIGWRAIREAKDATDLEPAFVQPIQPKEFDFDGQLEGYFVGLRDDANVYQVPVALDGTTGEILAVPIGVFAERQRAIEQKMSGDEVVDTGSR